MWLLLACAAAPEDTGDAELTLFPTVDSGDSAPLEGTWVGRLEVDLGSGDEKPPCVGDGVLDLADDGAITGSPACEVPEGELTWTFVGTLDGTLAFGTVAFAPEDDVFEYAFEGQVDGDALDVAWSGELETPDGSSATISGRFTTD